MLSRNRIAAACFASAWLSLAVASLSFHVTPPGSTRIGGDALDLVSGSNPSYTYLDAGAYCSDQNLDNETQRSAYGCPGYPGLTCVNCEGGDGMGISGIYGTILGVVPGTVTPSMGVWSCDEMEKWYGICRQFESGRYYCDTTINSFDLCSGSYPVYDYQAPAG